jgi:glycosyltransferase involved in cell wall biosynthesis
MTAGYYSPMPPARTGIADYSGVLIQELRKLGSINLHDAAADVCLYHLGNNQLHRGIYEQALAKPGVIVLHDAVLQHFFLGSQTESGYIEEFVYNYGPWHRGLAERLWRNRALSGTDSLYFRFPMLKRVVERSRAVIVHNRAAARIVREHVPAARVHEIPHVLMRGTEPPAYNVIRLRAALGVKPSDCLFGVFGHLRESKRLTTVLRVFRDLHGAGERVKLLVAGDFVSTDLARGVGPLLEHPGIVRAGHTAEEVFWTYAHAVDVAINLRYPTAGETSGIAIRMMGIGKPVVMTEGEEIAAIPEAAAIRVDPGPAEGAMLNEYMLWLTRFPNDARAIGERARRHISKHHDGPRVAALYWQALAEARG